MEKNTLNDYTFQNIDQITTSNVSTIIDYKNWIHSFEMQGRLPVVVKEYDRTTNIATCQITLFDIRPERDENGAYKRVQFPLIKTTVKQKFVNGVGIWYSPKENDTGWIVSADKNTSVWKNSEDLTKIYESDFSLPKFTFGYFEPDIVRSSKVSIVSGEEGSLCIQTTDGETAICINKNGKIHIIAKNGLTIDGNVQVNGDVVANGISLVEHIHSGVSIGSSNTNKPVAS